MTSCHSAPRKRDVNITILFFDSNAKVGMELSHYASRYVKSTHERQSKHFHGIHCHP